VRKLIEVLKRLGLWRPTLWEARSSLAVANPTLALSGTCERDVFFQDYLDGVFTDSLFRVSAAMSGLAPNTEYMLLITESPSGQTHGGSRRTDATGAWSGLIYIHGFPPGSNPPPNITLAGVVGKDANRDFDLDASEIVATDSFTIVCPARRYG
jgi:hypothetical protein